MEKLPALADASCARGSQAAAADVAAMGATTAGGPEASPSNAVTTGAGLGMGAGAGDTGPLAPAGGSLRQRMVQPPGR